MLLPGRSIYGFLGSTHNLFQTLAPCTKFTPETVPDPTLTPSWMARLAAGIPLKVTGPVILCARLGVLVTDQTAATGTKKSSVSLSTAGISSVSNLFSLRHREIFFTE